MKLRSRAVSNLASHGRNITLSGVSAEDILDLCTRALKEDYSRLIYKRKAQKRRTKHDEEDDFRR